MPALSSGSSGETCALLGKWELPFLTLLNRVETIPSTQTPSPLPSPPFSGIQRKVLAGACVRVCAPERNTSVKKKINKIK